MRREMWGQVRRVTRHPIPLNGAATVRRQPAVRRRTDRRRPEPGPGTGRSRGGRVTSLHGREWRRTGRRGGRDGGAAAPVPSALTDAERDEVESVLGRGPNHLELALFAVMWSEHCSYKSSRVHLRRLPTEGPHVLVGPGENAGVIDAGDRYRRGHPHRVPQPLLGHRALPGAATGVGGILRDIFTMGARPSP